MSDENRRGLRATEVAAAYGLSLSTVYRLKEKGLIRCFQPGGKGSAVLFPPDCLEIAGRLDTEAADTGCEKQAGKDSKLSGPRPKWMG